MKQQPQYRAYNVYFAYEAYDYVTVWTDSTVKAKQIALSNVNYSEDLTRTEGGWDYDGTSINIDGYEADDCAYVDERYSDEDDEPAATDPDQHAS